MIAVDVIRDQTQRCTRPASNGPRRNRARRRCKGDRRKLVHRDAERRDRVDFDLAVAVRPRVRVGPFQDDAKCVEVVVRRAHAGLHALGWLSLEGSMGSRHVDDSPVAFLHLDSGNVEGHVHADAWGGGGQLDAPG
jgi:hypothetical protein